MKKYMATFLTLAMMAIMVPLAANAQTRGGKRYRNDNNSRQNYSRNDNSRQNDNRYYDSNRNNGKSFYQRNRNLINIGLGTAAGAMIGGIIGGKKGALIGAGAGAGGSALYTYKINPKKKRYYRRP